MCSVIKLISFLNDLGKLLKRDLLSIFQADGLSENGKFLDLRQAEHLVDLVVFLKGEFAMVV